MIALHDSHIYLRDFLQIRQTKELPCEYHTGVPLSLDRKIRAQLTEIPRKRTSVTSVERSELPATTRQGRKATVRWTPEAAVATPWRWAGLVRNPTDRAV